MNEPWDCIVIGGGAAGLSAALVLGRARRTTLVIDAGRQSNLPAHAIGGLLGQDGTSPAALYAAGHEQLEALPSVELRGGEVARAERVERVGDAGAGFGGAADAGGGGGAAASRAGFALTLADGSRELTRRLLIATGMDYVPLDLPGVAPLWGDSVFHCPFCHGWEVQGRPWAVLDGTPHGFDRALLARNWSDDVVLLSNGPATLADDEHATLRQAGIALDERPVAELRADGGRLRAVAFADGGELTRDALLIGLTMEPRVALAEQLGLRLDGRGAIAVDGFQRSSLDGVFAAGDAGGSMQVAAALGSGGGAGGFLAMSLVAEDFGRAWPPLAR
ncbi:NAD(P)/FAD-dependent oxidoreductase [Conexibacter sp. CPCC 205706]|uniref:NAD(P)/FAD-dependent oxidoreductase n=1 Tax=unclassified Conexibacter TaxID=2627773 RepID=UPI00271BC4C1|nr:MULTISPECIES: NAD(P)/FAD-dependent oxidoreductase [unclassified Conexibacter]MDO8186384.1 NAD(P)/FAD-dependent oxidoreductase [Conexibacter sp. CPCC 205706]MDO8199783.1 NAD(P)/FAD-dependent oxidoreductase [Conexibacter sp. CPCC 205762]